MLVCSPSTLIQSQGTCDRVVGGLKTTLYGDWKDVDSVTVVAGIVTAVTFKVPTVRLFELQGDDDNTSQYNQTDARNGNSFRFNQEANIKFSGANNAKVVAVNNLKGVRKLLCFHIYNSGVILTQGVEMDATGLLGQPSFIACKADPSVNSNTGEGESDVTIKLVSSSQDALPCSITETVLRTYL